MAPKKKKRIVLIDAHALIHRAYHALPNFVSGKGEPTGALYGLATMLMRAIEDLKPDYLVACFDLPKPTFRHAAFAGYKAHRKKTDDDLKEQLGRSRTLFTSFSIPIYESEGFEADDILGTIAKKLHGRDMEIVIASGDMDTLQLVTGDEVKVLTLKKGLSDTVLYNEEKVNERFGFGPKLIPDYKGLAGDASDNIPGVKGIGDKTATILIGKFGTLENLYKALKKNEKKVLEAGVKERLVGLLKENEEEALFSKTLAEIRDDAPIDFILPEKPWREAMSYEKVIEFFDEVGFGSLRERARRVFDGPKKEEADGVKTGGSGKEEEEKETVNPDTLKKAVVALWLLDSEKIDADWEDVKGRTRKENPEEALEVLEKEIQKEKLSFVYEKIELPLIPIVNRMKEHGITLNTVYLKKLSISEHERLSKIEKEIWKLTGGEFNINSPKQLGEVLFERLRLETKGVKKTGTGARSTNIDTLVLLKDAHPAIPLIIEHREHQKLLSTYIDALPELCAADGRLHATFLQNGAATGRFSSVNPNLQNIPTKGETGKLVRKAFVAPPGKTFIACDYSQVELRAAAVLSGDEKLLAVFHDDKDPHAAVAARVFGVPEKMVTEEMRRRAKVVNFGILYGMGILALKEALGTDRKEAQEFYDAYRNTFARLMIYLDEVKINARKSGYTETLFGRRRHLSLLRSPIPYLRASGERMAINAPMQGTSADIIKLAMIDVDDFLRGKGLEKDAALVLQVHDELIFEVTEEKASQISKEIARIMEKVVEKHKKDSAVVPFPVSTHIGNSWDIV